MPKAPKPPSPRIGPADIKAAISRSGYPLELRVFERFDAESHVYVDFNRIVPVGNDPDGTPRFREIDLHVLFRAWRDRPDGGGGLHRGASLRALIEVKGFDENAAFVGLRTSRTSHDANRLALVRCTIGGRPSCGVGRNRHGDHAVLNSSIPAALAPLYDGANLSCQWAIARRRDKSGVEVLVADHEDPFHEALQTLVRGAREFDLYYTSVAARYDHVAMIATMPALVVRDGSLFEMDIDTNDVRPVRRLLLDRPFQLGEFCEDRTVDVVEESAVPEMIARYRRTLDRLVAAVDADGDALAAAAAEDRADRAK